VSLRSEETELSKTRYQQGSIRRLRRKGPDVWVFRWRSAQADGSRKETTRVIGTVLEYRTKAAATFCRRSMQMEHTKKSHPVVGLIILIVLGYLVYQAISSIT
jgi:hypothetical protein